MNKVNRNKISKNSHFIYRKYLKSLFPLFICKNDYDSMVVQVFYKRFIFKKDFFFISQRMNMSLCWDLFLELNNFLFFMSINFLKLCIDIFFSINILLLISILFPAFFLTFFPFPFFFLFIFEFIISVALCFQQYYSVFELN
jgi:hypothetical protein